MTSRISAIPAMAALFTMAVFGNAADPVPASDLIGRWVGNVRGDNLKEVDGISFFEDKVIELFIDAQYDQIACKWVEFGGECKWADLEYLTRPYPENGLQSRNTKIAGKYEVFKDKLSIILMAPGCGDMLYHYTFHIDKNTSPATLHLSQEGSNKELTYAKTTQYPWLTQNDEVKKLRDELAGAWLRIEKEGRGKTIGFVGLMFNNDGTCVRYVAKDDSDVSEENYGYKIASRWALVGEKPIPVLEFVGAKKYDFHIDERSGSPVLTLEGDKLSIEYKKVASLPWTKK